MWLYLYVVWLSRRVFVVRWTAGLQFSNRTFLTSLFRCSQVWFCVCRQTICVKGYKTPHIYMKSGAFYWLVNLPVKNRQRPPRRKWIIDAVAVTPCPEQRFPSAPIVPLTHKHKLYCYDYKLNNREISISTVCTFKTSKTPNRSFTLENRFIWASPKAETKHFLQTP